LRLRLLTRVTANRSANRSLELAIPAGLRRSHLEIEAVPNVGDQSIRAALYLRVSTANGQTTDKQRLELNAVADRDRWQMVEIYEDAGISGGKGREKRPAFDCMLKGGGAPRVRCNHGVVGRPARALAAGPDGVFFRTSMPRASSYTSTSKHRYDHALG
jgi:hypothetical protein